MAQTVLSPMTVPPDVAELVNAQLDQGSYASGEEVLRDAMQALQERATARTMFMREKIAEADADPRLDLTNEDVTEHFRQCARPGDAPSGDPNSAPGGHA